MKNITRFFAVAGAVLALASCNKAEFKSYSFVSFTNARLSASEDCGTLDIPLYVYGSKEATVTYKVVDGSAILDQDYSRQDKTGIVKVDAENGGKISFNIVDNTGKKTGNKTFSVELVECVGDESHLGATSVINVTIIDLDGGLDAVMGDWYGESADGNMTFTIVDCDPETDEYAPEDCNCKILAGGNIDNNDMDFAYDIYLRYDKDHSKLYMYDQQIFNGYNFTSLGPAYVAFASEDGSEIAFAVGSNQMVLESKITVALLNPDTYEWNIDGKQYYYTEYAAGMTFTK